MNHLGPHVEFEPKFGEMGKKTTWYVHKKWSPMEAVQMCYCVLDCTTVLEVFHTFMLGKGRANNLFCSFK